MPSIEIICVGQKSPLRFSRLPFALEAESDLISHRSPLPLFQTEFDVLQGCIYHLGSPELRDPAVHRCYTAYELLEKESTKEWWYIIKFAQRFIAPVKELLRQLMDASPSGQVIFTSDYQFGPDAKRYKRPLSLGKFWELHDVEKLRMNALYQLKR